MLSIFDYLASMRRQWIELGALIDSMQAENDFDRAAEYERNGMIYRAAIHRRRGVQLQQKSIKAKALLSISQQEVSQ